MKRLSIISIFMILFAIHSMAWERVSTQLDLANNADPNKVVVYDLWKSFVEAHNDSTTDFPQWNDADKIKWKYPDLVNCDGYLTTDLYSYLNKVIEIRPENDVYVIRSMFFTPYNENTEIYVLAITNHIAKKDENGEFKLYNWIDYNTRNWPRKAVGVFDYCYYPGFDFNEDIAREANNTVTMFRDKLGANVPNRITYYIAQNQDEEFKIKGFDYVAGMGDHVGNTGGSTDTNNFIVYGDSVHGENFEQEICRATVNATYPNVHFLLTQGIAGYVHQGKEEFGLTYRQHYQRMKDWLEAHPNDDIANYNSRFYIMDNQTAPTYLVGKIVCYELYKKGGYDALKRAFNTKPTVEDFFTFLKKEIGIDQKDFNQWMRKQIAKYTTQDIPPLR